MNAETVKALREILGHSQRTMAEEIGVSERAVRNWELGTRNVPQDVADWLIDQLAQHDELVNAVLEDMYEVLDEHGWQDPEVVTLPYWRTQDEMKEAGGEGEVGVINARTREIAQALRREGLKVQFTNES